MVEIFCKNNNVSKSFKAGSTLYEIVEEFGLDIKNPICAHVNNKVEGLSYVVFKNKDVEFLDLHSSAALRAYSRALFFVLSKAVSDSFAEGSAEMANPVSKGFYCPIHIGRKITGADVEKIKRRMTEIINSKLPFIRHECRTSKAIEIFSSAKRQDAVRLLMSTGQLYSYYYTLGESVDYFFGCMPPDTGFLTIFDIELCEQGVLMRVPDKNNPDKLEEKVQQKKMFEVFREHHSWQKILGVSTVGDFNMACKNGGTTSLINVAEALQSKKIVHIADTILSRRQSGANVKVILISGPSSSGKTTFSKRLQIQLMANGLTPKIISIDNYFVDREQTPKDLDGNLDYESFYALDLNLFHTQINNLIQGNSVELPTFNFSIGAKEYHGNKMHLDKNDILIMEGIHALNPQLTPNIPDSMKYLVYVSALTSIRLDNHNYIQTTDNRLLRRILRDYKYRGYSACQTIARWPSVRAGEDKWIFPFQENADAMFNSALLFEIAVLKDLIDPILAQVPEDQPEYAEAHRLRNFLKLFISITDLNLPPTSLLREFIGGSSFRY